jgi:pimeloyl-ACP methyl ester carboxylesterase
MNEVTGQLVKVTGASIYCATRGSGPVVLIMGGGPGNADTLEPLASRLAEDFTVVTYDRRGYSRSQLDDPHNPAGGELSGIQRHADDARQLIAARGGRPVSVFGTSFGALIALELAATAPDAVGPVVVHEPPLGQVLAGDERPPFDLNLGSEPDAGAALDAIAASVGVSRGRGSGGAAPDPADVELFVRRDVPAIGGYRLDLGRLRPVAGRLVVTGSEGSRDYYPYQCARRLAGQLGTPLLELPGDHAGMIRHPAEFATRLRSLLRPPDPAGTRTAEDYEGVTKCSS